ncbi:MAG: discoidin domain-containing protein [Mangrovibacterium sp.]
MRKTIFTFCLIVTSGFGLMGQQSQGDKGDGAAYLDGHSSIWTTIRNGALWEDTNGNPVHAHGAGFLNVGNTWYMIGEDRSNTWNPDVNMYSSKDLVTWKFERKIIANGITHPELGKSRFIERPKLMYCKTTGKYVVWCHWEQSNYGASEAAVFYCDSVNGPYKYHWSGRPLGIKSRDCNIFIDNDGTAYFISTTNENRDLGLFRLSDDYLSVVSHTPLFPGQGREAPAIVRVGNTYFMISSACTGWDPNQAKISHSTSLFSGWSALTNIGNRNSFDTQAASVLTIYGTQDTTYLYVGDRWKDPDLPASKTIMFPIQFSGNNCTFNYRQQFDVNFLTGRVRETSTTNLVPKNGWSVRAFSSQGTRDENCSASNAIDGNISTFWHTKHSGFAASAPHSIEIDMGAEYEVYGFLPTPIMDGSTNGLIREFLFYISIDGENWEKVAGGDWMPYFADVYFTPVKARYFRLVSLSGTIATLAEIDILQSHQQIQWNDPGKCLKRESEKRNFN